MASDTSNKDSSSKKTKNTLFGFGYLAIALSCFTFIQVPIRHLEASLATLITKIWAGSAVRTLPGNSYIRIDPLVGRPIVVSVATVCTVAVLVAIIALGAAIVSFFPSVSPKRIFFAYLQAVLIVFVGNMLRLILIVSATYQWGVEGGFHWTHLYIGPAISFVALAIASLSFIRKVIEKKTFDTSRSASQVLDDILK